MSTNKIVIPEIEKRLGKPKAQTGTQLKKRFVIIHCSQIAVTHRGSVMKRCLMLSGDHGPFTSVLQNSRYETFGCRQICRGWVTSVEGV